MSQTCANRQTSVHVSGRRDIGGCSLRPPNRRCETVGKAAVRLLFSGLPLRLRLLKRSISQPQQAGHEQSLDLLQSPLYSATPRPGLSSNFRSGPPAIAKFQDPRDLLADKKGLAPLSGHLREGHDVTDARSGLLVRFALRVHKAGDVGCEDAQLRVTNRYQSSQIIIRNRNFKPNGGGYGSGVGMALPFPRFHSSQHGLRRGEINRTAIFLYAYAKLTSRELGDQIG